MKRFWIGIMAAIASCALVFGLSACSETGKSVAATVNGDKIYEEDVTTYVEQLRSYYGCTDDADWATFLSYYGYQPSDIRDIAINALAQEKIIEQKCDEEGVTVSDDEIDQKISEIRDQAGYTDDQDWSDALTQAGYESEDEYRDVVKDGLLQEKLCEKDVENADPDDATVLSSCSSFAGEKASHILVSDEAQANEICDRINNASDKSAQFSQELGATQDTGDSAIADSDGNLGWTSVNYMAYLYLPNTSTALGTMNVGDCAVVSESDGYHVVYCTGKFVCDDPSTLTKEQVPTDIWDYVFDQVKSSNYNTACSDYIQSLVDGADIQTNEMPSGLSYDVDMSLAETDSASSDTTGSTSSDVSNTVFYEDDQGTYYYDDSGNKVYLQIQTEDSQSSTSTSGN